MRNRLILTVADAAKMRMPVEKQFARRPTLEPVIADDALAPPRRFVDSDMCWPEHGVLAVINRPGRARSDEST